MVYKTEQEKNSAHFTTDYEFSRLIESSVLSIQLDAEEQKLKDKVDEEDADKNRKKALAPVRSHLVSSLFPEANKETAQKRSTPYSMVDTKGLLLDDALKAKMEVSSYCSTRAIHPARNSKRKCQGFKP